MTNTISSRLAPERCERDENRYLDPSSERYATQLAAVVFGWGPWSAGDLADAEGLVDSCRGLAASSDADVEASEAWVIAMMEADIRSA